MKSIECPENLDMADLQKSVFLAGGITGCPDWQRQLIWLLSNEDITLVNPRRENFPDPTGKDLAETRFQIKWEFKHLRMVDCISFWFPAATLCPITLYELGTWTIEAGACIAIGVEPGYAREADIRIQTELVDPKIPIVNSLEALAEEIIKL